MKLLYLACLLCLPALTFSQSTIRCGTVQYWENKKQQDPSLVLEENRINQEIEHWLSQNEMLRNTNTVVTIPVVFHVLYYNSGQNLSDVQLDAQISVLNADFAKLNADTNLVPGVWKSTHANTQIQFCRAVRDPGGNASNGVERRSSSQPTWDVLSNDNIKHYSTGGLDAWNRNSYVNIWIADITNGILGITQPPGGNANTDGIVLLYSSVGSVAHPGPPNGGYNLGRTCTHEMGHWLGLHHIWGDGSGCSPDDLVADTPLQEDENYGCPSFPQLDACTNTSPGVMYMNYMDYTDDACMYMFTAGQSTRMNGLLSTTRASLLVSAGCIPVGIDEINLLSRVNIYPNPSAGKVTIETHFPQASSLEIIVTDLPGKIVLSQREKNVTSDRISISMEGIADGIYNLTLRTPAASCTQKISVIH